MKLGASDAEPAGWGQGRGRQPLREVTLIVVQGREGGRAWRGAGKRGIARPFGFENKNETKSCTILLTNNGHVEALKWFRI